MIDNNVLPVLAGRAVLARRVLDCLLHIPKGAFTAKIPMFLQTHFLLGGSMFLQRHNAVILVIKQLGFGQIAQGLVGIAVPDLDTGPKQFRVFLAIHVVGAIIFSHRSSHDCIIYIYGILYRWITSMV